MNECRIESANFYILPKACLRHLFLIRRFLLKSMDKQKENDYTRILGCIRPTFILNRKVRKDCAMTAMKISLHMSTLRALRYHCAHGGSHIPKLLCLFLKLQFQCPGMPTRNLINSKPWNLNDQPITISTPAYFHI